MVLTVNIFLYELSHLYINMHTHIKTWYLTCEWSRSVVSDSLQPHGLYVAHQVLHPWNFPGKSTGVGCHFLLQGIFPTQGSNLGLPNCRQMLYHLSHQGIYMWVICIFLSVIFMILNLIIWKAYYLWGGGKQNIYTTLIASDLLSTDLSTKK